VPVAVIMFSRPIWDCCNFLYVCAMRTHECLFFFVHDAIGIFRWIKLINSRHSGCFCCCGCGVVADLQVIVVVVCDMPRLTSDSIIIVVLLQRTDSAKVIYKLPLESSGKSFYYTHVQNYNPSRWFCCETYLLLLYIIVLISHCHCRRRSYT